jgi:hypothetical protein
MIVKENGEVAVKAPKLQEVRWIFEGVPSWFITAMRKLDETSPWWTVTKDVEGTDSDWHGDGEAAIMVFQEQFDSHGWRDHDGWIEQWGQTILVSEPYLVEANALVRLLDFVNKCNLEMKIFGVSNHFPGRTLRIMIWPKEK